MEVQKNLLDEFDELLEEQNINTVVGDFEKHMEECFLDFKNNIVRKLKVVIQNVFEKVSELEKRVVDLETDRENMDSKQIQDIKIQLNRQQQYSRKDNIRIFGLEESASNEDCKQVVCNFINHSLKVNIQPSDISAAHRLPKSGKQTHKPMIVRLKDRSQRQAILQVRRKLKGSHKSIGEDMTKDNVKLVAEAEASKCFKSVWFYNGRVKAEDHKKRKYTLELFDNFEAIVK